MSRSMKRVAELNGAAALWTFQRRGFGFCSLGANLSSQQCRNLIAR